MRIALLIIENGLMIQPSRNRMLDRIQNVFYFAVCLSEDPYDTTLQHPGRLCSLNKSGARRLEQRILNSVKAFGGNHPFGP